MARLLRAMGRNVRAPVSRRSCMSRHASAYQLLWSQVLLAVGQAKLSDRGTAPRDKTDPATQQATAPGPRGIEPLRVDGSQQPEAPLETARLQVAFSGHHHALQPSGRVGRQGRRALEKSRPGSEAAAQACSGGSTLEIGGDVVVGSGSRLGPGPRTALRVDARLGGV